MSIPEKEAEPMDQKEEATAQNEDAMELKEDFMTPHCFCFQSIKGKSKGRHP